MKRVIQIEGIVGNAKQMIDQRRSDYATCELVFRFDVSKPLLDEGILDKLLLVNQIEIPLGVNKALSEALIEPEEDEDD